MKRILAWAVLISVGLCGPGAAYVPPVGPGKCVGNCGSSSPPPRSYDTTPAPGPSTDQVQREQRATEMQALLVQSDQAERGGNLEEALRLLGQALDKADDPVKRAEINRRAALLRDRIEAAARAARDRQRAEMERAAGETIDGILRGAPDFDRRAPPSPSDGGPGDFKPAPGAPPAVTSAPMPPATELRPNREPNFYPATKPAPPPPMPLPKGLHFHDVPVPSAELMPRNDPRFPFDRATLDLLREVLDQVLTTPPVVAERLIERLMRGSVLTPSAMEAASYVDGMVQAYAAGRQRRLQAAAAPPEPPPRGTAPPQASPGPATDRDALVRRINAAKMARGMAERNAILALAVRDAPMEAPESVLDSLHAQYRLTGNAAVLDAIRYLEGGRRYGEAASRQDGR